MAAPTTQTALVCAGAGQYRLDHDVQVAPPGPGALLCAVKAVALNPADWKMIDFSATADLVGGHEFAGEVVQVGAGVSGFQPGDRILAPVPGLNECVGGAGAFCQYAAVAADMVCRIPDGVSFEDAAGLSVVTCTAALALYQALGLPLPHGDGAERAAAADTKQPFYVLVSGGASATGTIAIQLLKASGLAPIATCSPENRDMLMRLGAVETFDYHSATCGMEIRNYTGNTLAHVLDCVTQAESMTMAYEAIGPAGGKYIALDPFPTRIQYTRREVTADWVMGLSLFGQAVKLAGVYGRPARPQDRVFTTQLLALLERMLAAGALKPHPVELRAGGLAAVTEGIEDLRMGRVRARKLVYPVA